MSVNEQAATVLVIYGNPKHGGFIHGSLDHIANHISSKGHHVDRLHLIDADIQECTGCFNCLRKGACVIDDDMAGIIDRMRSADALVTGASVRNSYFPALYKKFYERITYILGFGRDLRAVPVVAVGSVGMASGKKDLGKVLTFKEFHTRIIDYLFFQTGIPTKITVDDAKPKLEAAADSLIGSLDEPAKLPFFTSLSAAVDDFILKKFMLEKNPDHVYDYVIESWREKGKL